MNKRLGLLFVSILTCLSACAPKEKALSISQLPYKLDYTVNELLTLEGLSVVDEYNHQVLDYETTLQNNHKLTVIGEIKISVIKENYKSTSFNITVHNEKQLEVRQRPNKIQYKVGEALDLTGLVIYDNEGNEVTGYTTDPSNGYLLNELGTKTVIVSKNNYKSTTFSVSVVEEIVYRLEVVNKPTKLNYKVGEKFDSTGLKVYSGNEIVTDYQLSIKNGETLANPGLFDVIVSKPNYVSTSFSIIVEEEKIRDDRSLNIYYINDTHGSFVRQNTSDKYYEAGMSNIASYMLEKRNNNPENTIVLSGGDMFQGGYESNMTRGMIMADAMNIAQFDAMVLGNHELDWGEQALKNVSETLVSPIISCNTFYSSDFTSQPEYIKPYTIIVKDGLKIGIIGAAEEDMGSSITGSISNAFYFPDPVPYIKKYSDELRNEYKCDVVLAGFHAGGFDSDSFDYPEITNVSPQSGEKYVDAIFLAHDHRYGSGNVNTVPYVKAGCNGRWIGQVTINLEYNKDSYDVVTSNSTYYSAFDNCKTPNTEVDKLLIKYAEQIGDPNQVITTLSKDYSKAEFAEVIARSMFEYVNNHKELFGNVTVYFSTHNVSGVRNSLSRGDLTISELVDAYPFENYLSIQTCTSKQISYMKTDSYYSCYDPGQQIYSGGYTHAVTINYIAENNSRYSNYYQTSYITYSFITARETLIDYILNGAIL